MEYKVHYFKIDNKEYFRLINVKTWNSVDLTTSQFDKIVTNHKIKLI